MNWVRLHPYASAIIGAGLFLVIGTIMVMRAASTPTPIGISTWSGNPSALNPVPQQVAVTHPTTVATVPIPTNYGTATLPYPSNQASSTGASAKTPSGPFDYDTLMAQLAANSHTGSKSTSGSTSVTTSSNTNIWNFIPSGMIATTSPIRRTPTQQALYLYGNEIGSYVEGYDAANSNQVQILSDANNDRQNATKAAGVVHIGMSLQTVGAGIAQTTDVPPSAASANAALANSYITIGKALVVVGQSEALSDKELVSAIQAYDSAVNDFNKKYIALATIFSLNGVTFSKGDPGSVFSFSSNSL